MNEEKSHARAVEDSLREFYDSKGWRKEGDISHDATLWEDTRRCAAEYVSRCRLRVTKFLPKSGDALLDAASGPIQYPEYLAFSRGFKKRVCVDLSVEALVQAQAKIGAHGEFVKCSILDLPFPANFFDSAISLHTIYHIEAQAQERAVRELLRVTKEGRAVLVVYANPDRLSSRAARVARSALRALKGTSGPSKPAEVYYHAHSLSWWDKFTDEADVRIVTWRTLTAKVSRLLIPDNVLGYWMLKALSSLEDSFPRAALPLAAYPMIVLTKKRKGAASH
jgi:ubiquinone/menaquinone biosynthesis C-methylase UbiE